ncbi:MAG: ABC transporter permease [Negativicutes bacterium]|nr:ABC transporter permease [Negativicutes bacterium]
MAGIRGPLEPLYVLWRYRALVLRLSRRDLESRYRGSILGLAWTVIHPLLMLAVYTFIFSVVFQARWGTASTGGTAKFALYLFSGMVLFSIFSDCVIRAPGLMLENVSYIKKVVFPLEIMPMVVLLVALFNAVVGFGILFVFYLVVLGLPPWTALLIPLVLLPLCLFTLGLVWFLASAGVFLRDLRQMVSVFITIAMFLSPIFYPLSAIPERFRGVILLNPLALLLERSKDVLFLGIGLSPLEWALYCGIAWIWAWLGYIWFIKTRRGFADVV